MGVIVCWIPCMCEWNHERNALEYIGLWVCVCVCAYQELALLQWGDWAWGWVCRWRGSVSAALQTAKANATGRTRTVHSYGKSYLHTRHNDYVKQWLQLHAFMFSSEYWQYLVARESCYSSSSYSEFGHIPASRNPDKLPGICLK